MKFIKESMKFKLSTFIAIAMLSACQVTDKVKSEETESLNQLKQEIEPSEAVPNSDLTGDVLYQLLSAEIAKKRGQFDFSLSNYSAAANTLNNAEIAKRAAGIALYTKDKEAIERTSKRWLELDPKNPEASKALVAVYLIDNNRVQATHYAQRFYDQHEDKTIALKSLANLILKKHASKVSLLVLSDLIDLYPDSENLLFIQAKFQYGDKQLKQALVSINKALKINNDFIEAFIVKSALLFDLGSGSEIVFLEKVIKDHPESLKLRLTILKFLLEKEKNELVVPHLEVAYELSKHKGENVFTLALLALESNHNKLAAQYFKRVIHLGEYLNSANYYLGRMASMDAKHELALEYYSQVAHGTHQLEAKLRMVETLVILNKIDLALKHISILKQSYPVKSEKRLEISMLEAELLRSSGNYKASYEVLNNASLTHPNNVNLLYAKALSADRINKHHEFEKDLRIILKKQPNNALALNALGYYLVSKTDRLDEAEELILKAYTIEPEDAAILDSVGWLKFRRGDLKEAMVWLKKAHKKQFDPEISAHTGEVYWLLNNKKKAKSIWEKAIKSFPNDAELQDTLKRYKIGFE